MRLDAKTLKAAEQRGRAVPAAPAAAPRLRTAAASTLRMSNLGASGAVPSPAEFEAVLGTNDLVDEFWLERGIWAAKPVCRVVVRDAALRENAWATGFMVSPRLLLTNWHVFNTAADAENGIAEFDYRLDIHGDPLPAVRFLIKPGDFFLAWPDLDYALVAVSEFSLDGASPLSGFGYHRLVPNPGKILEGEWITIIQHPGGQPKQFALRANQLIQKQDQFLWYASDTAHGSSGAPAFNDSYQVVALHHAGCPKRDNGRYVLRDGTRVDSLDGVDDSDVEWEKNEGLRVSVLCADIGARAQPDHPLVRQLIETMNSDGGDIMTQAVKGRTAAVTNVEAAPVQGAGKIVVPLQLEISLSLAGGAAVQVAQQPQPGTSQPAAAASTAGASASGASASGAPIAIAPEKMVQPITDPNYADRAGYDENYLGVPIPLPEVTDDSLVSHLDDNTCVLRYEHFSVVQHKTRRLALFTASNVDARPKSTRPEPGDYSRDGLTGLSSKDQEKWITDPRIPEQHQLPDNFYNSDGGAFDKGHIVRREDVCWGKSRAEVVRANGDTFHTTNCSPQVADFNRSNEKGTWGELEDYIQKQAKTDRFTLMAGPATSGSKAAIPAGPCASRSPAASGKLLPPSTALSSRPSPFSSSRTCPRCRWPKRNSRSTRTGSTSSSPLATWNRS